MNFTFSFSSRGKYLLEKRRWSGAYQDQVQAIRDAKLKLKSAHRELQKSRSKISDVWAAERTLQKTRSDILDLLKVRGEMSREAQKQYLAQKNLERQ